MNEWEEEYKRKLTTPEEVTKTVKDGGPHILRQRFLHP